MQGVIEADAAIRLAPTNTKPVTEVIVNFAEQAGVDEWIAYVLPGGLIMVFVIEESLS